MKCKRITSGFLAFTMTAILALGDAGAAFAAESERFFREAMDLTGGSGYADATSSNASFENHTEKDLIISVSSTDQSDFRAGGQVYLDVHIKNETDSVITDGVLKYKGNSMIEKGSAYFELPDEDEDPVTEGAWTVEGEEPEYFVSQDVELENDLGVEGEDTDTDTDFGDNYMEEDDDSDRRGVYVAGSQSSKETDEEWDEEESEETDEDFAEEIEGIELAPGQIYSARFVYTISDQADRVKNESVNFRFKGTAGDRKVSQSEKFQYTINYLNIDTVQFENGNRVETGEEVTMGIHTSMYDFDALLADTEVEEALKASASNAQKATDSNAQLATGSNAAATPSDATPSDSDEDEDMDAFEDEEDNDNFVVDLGDTKYEIEMINARLNDFEVRKALVSDANENMMVCTFRVSKHVKPGIYFGRVKQESKTKNKKCTSTQGFALIVTGSGEIELEADVKNGDGTITVSGPVEAFPDANQLVVTAEEVDLTTRESVQKALQAKAAAEGIDIHAFKALDIKLWADGKEVHQMDGDIRVAFKGVELSDKLPAAPTAEETAAAETAMFTAVAPKKMMRAAAAKLSSAKAEPAALSTEAETAAAAEKTAASENVIQVWHLDVDDESLPIEEKATSVDEESGDVVMGTDHFSIYIVVSTGLTGGEIKVKVEHYGTVKTIDGNGTNASHVKLDENKVGSQDPKGRRFGYYTVDNVYDRYKEEIVPTEYTGKLYTTDEIALPNEIRDLDIESLSKLCLATAGKEYNQKNYEISDIYISDNWANAEKEIAQWKGTVQHIKVNRNGAGVVTNNETITLTKNSVIRFIYKEKEVTGQYLQDVTFWDHNVGGTYSTTDGKQIGANAGSNTPENFNKSNKRKYKIGVGQNASGNASSPWNDAKSSIGYLNKGNNWGDVNGVTAEDYPLTDSEGKRLAPFAVIAKGIVKDELNSNGKLVFRDDIANPGFFDGTKTGNKILTDYKLGFKQTGDTYTLSSVKKGSTNVLTGLEKIKYSVHSGAGDTNLYSNEFWPLDGENYSGIDAHGSNSDDGGAHNWHFAMRYDFSFKVGDYTGPMNYYFRGDDDFWMFVDGKKVIDLGGIHSAVGEAVDLRAWLIRNKLLDENDEASRNKVHEASIFYMERGGFGSCCYMQFTLPNCTPVDIPEIGTTSLTATKKWDDNNSPARPTSIKVELLRKRQGESLETVVDTQTLTKDSNWTYTWQNLPDSDVNTGKQYVYRVRETDVPNGYTSSVQNNTITNALQPVKVNVIKKWDDDTDRDGKRPKKLKLQLQWSKDGGKNWGKYPGSTGTTAEKEIDIDPNTNQCSAVFENLPKYTYDASGNATEIQYRVLEMNNNAVVNLNGKLGDYTLSAMEHSQNDDGAVTATTTMTNKYQPESVSRTVVKNWVGVPDYMETSVKVGIYEGDSTGKFSHPAGWKAPENWANPVTLKKDKNSNNLTGTYTWTNLPKYKNHGQLVSYNIYELDGTNQIKRNGVHTFDGYSYKVDVGTQVSGGSNSGTVTITNTLLKAKLRVVKNVEAPDGYEGPDFDEYKFLINVYEKGSGQLYAALTRGDGENAKEYIEVIPPSNGKNFEIEEIVPMEYSMKGMTGGWTPNTSSVAFPQSQFSYDAAVQKANVTLKPGDDITITVTNVPSHDGYFHHTTSVTNVHQGVTGGFVQEDNYNEKPNNNSTDNATTSAILNAVMPKKVEEKDNEDVKLA